MTRRDDSHPRADFGGVKRIDRGPAEDRVMKRVFLSPAVLILLALSIFPLLWSLGISFTDMQRGGSTIARQAASAGIESGVGFLGLGFEITGRNYERLLDDTRLHSTVRNTMIYVFFGVFIQYSIGLGLATVLNQPFRGRNIVRVIFLMPMMMTPVAAAYTGRMFFDSNPLRSPLAHFLRELSKALGLENNISIPWFTDLGWAPVAILIIDAWQWIPFMTLILLAGMQAIPEDIYEAARVDGANVAQIFARITLPILLPISLTVILIRGLEIFKIIDVVVVTTGGGPGSATESLTLYIFEQALSNGNYGYASAIAYVLLVLVIIFATIFLATGRRLGGLRTG
ncbi:MAG: sugar ABC transporter permease [Chloroflexi bacterium]|nr:sugar ABC transporter permease [Chloroflexota bacterium]MCY4246768.1 sugar ABC transporter permease [Chloroflexota bacterium]